MMVMADIETWKESSFEEKYGAMMEGMSEEQQRKRAEDVLHLCRCDRCPTNTDKEELDAVYCTLRKGKETREEKGCLCEDCPITKNDEFTLRILLHSWFSSPAIRSGNR
ncbi:MAG: DUF2769 domain-containing protein [Candidatus Lokiarchaeota archaeon]|nr:DUF2769 domain-containing protein [Candidatus Lokiarchaeota archaeon]